MSIFRKVSLLLVTLVGWSYSQGGHAQLPIDFVSDNFEGPGADTAIYGENSDWEVKYDDKLVVDGGVQSGYFEKVPNIFSAAGVRVNSQKSFGIKAAFKLKGYNWLDLVPKQMKDPYKGLVENVSLWLWGHNSDYTAEIHFNNSKGDYYRINLGSIAYVGWKRLVANVAPAISKNSLDDVLSKDVGMRFVKIRFYSTPKARADQFYTFVDYMTVSQMSDREYYDGEDVEKDLDKMFGEGGGSGATPTVAKPTATPAAATAVPAK